MVGYGCPVCGGFVRFCATFGDVDNAVGGDAIKNTCAIKRWRCRGKKMVFFHAVAIVKSVAVYTCNPIWN